MMNKKKGKIGDHPKPSFLNKGTKKLWEKVGQMCMAQCNSNEVSSALGISHEALVAGINRTFDKTVCVKHVSDSCEECGEDGKQRFTDWTGYRMYMRASGKMLLKATQFEVATRMKSPDMLKWLGKQYLGQSEKQVNHNLNTGFDPSGMSDEELKKFQESYAKSNTFNDTTKGND